MARVKTYTKEHKSKSPQTRHKQTNVSIGDFIHFILSVVAALALIISYLSVFIDPAIFPIPSFFGLYFIPIVCINAVLFLISIVQLKKTLFISLIAILPSLFIVELFYKSSNEEKSYSETPIKLLTYNVGRFSSSKEGYNLYETCNFANNLDADIICFQECSIKDTTFLNNYFENYPYHHKYFFKSSEFFGNITYSKYPIVDAGRMTFNDSRNLYIWCDINYKNNIIRIYNCHLESQGISFTSLIKKLGQKDMFANEVKNVHEKFLKATVRRSTQVNELLESTDNCKYPSIICGDFNDTPISHTYYRLRQNRSDSFIEGGKGFSATYSYLWPLLRIDYILHSKAIDSDQYQIMKVPYSDHYPVSTLLYLNSTTEQNYE